MKSPTVLETLRKYRDEIADLDALTYAAHRLADGVSITGDEEDMEDAAESVGVASALMRIAHRQLRYLAAEIDDEIARTLADVPPSSEPSP